MGVGQRKEGRGIAICLVEEETEIEQALSGRPFTDLKCLAVLF